MESPNVDYKKIMEIQKENLPDWPGIYESGIEGIERDLDFSMDVRNILHTRRIFGLEKYGEMSYESSLANTLVAPTIALAKEELQDCLNYIMHEIYKNGITGDSELIVELKRSARLAYAVLHDLNKFYPG